METNEIVEKIEKMDTKDVALALSGETSLFFNVAKFEHCQRVATMLHKAKMWPDHLKSIGDAMVVLNLAERLQSDPVMLAQNISIIHGKPGFEGKLVIALVNSCGRFDPIEFEKIGNLKRPDNGNDGCIAYAKEIKSGKILKGPRVDWDMVQKEGWYNKPGSKWKTMAPLMFRYRAASYFANVFCPEVKLGMYSKEELQDIIDITPRSTPCERLDGKPKVDKKTYLANISKETFDKKIKPLIDGDRGKVDLINEKEMEEITLISAFSKLNKGPLQKFEEAHRNEIPTWPGFAQDAFHEKWEAKMKQPYEMFLRRLKVINGEEDENQEQNKPEYISGTVVCPEDGIHTTENACQNKKGFEKPCETYKSKECLVRYPE